MPDVLASWRMASTLEGCPRASIKRSPTCNADAVFALKPAAVQTKTKW
eukprot:CAMPEP_0170598872 /NCGR_PEP_ID=MMETSP0224-20130122/16486_1 /TAXON_ID=285029 /ORGANISM="Togula jolla, Strain CCCM 725" /LENGTH=47 /DNA_ID= /DNA_START= /DNA_END= /DNA_ORIENTATION=